jgi:hypothetical protein
MLIGLAVPRQDREMVGFVDGGASRLITSKAAPNRSALMRTAPGTFPEAIIRHAAHFDIADALCPTRSEGS